MKLPNLEFEYEKGKCNKCFITKQKECEEKLKYIFKKKYGITLYRSTTKLIKKRLTNRGYIVKYIKGIPDFFYIIKKEIIFVECKRNPNDGLRWSQVKWISDHKQYQVYVVYVDVI